MSGPGAPGTPPTPRRWPRAQKFVICDSGCEAEAQYRSSIVASRQQEGRASYDAARIAWATEYRLQPDDGLYLAEVRPGPISLAEMVDSLESCGKSHRDALAALERLLERGFVRPVSTP